MQEQRPISMDTRSNESKLDSTEIIPDAFGFRTIPQITQLWLINSLGYEVVVTQRDTMRISHQIFADVCLFCMGKLN